MEEEKKTIYEGIVTLAFPNGMFQVCLVNDQNVILGHISGKIRRKSIRIMVGDRVRIEVSPYDKTKGRIIYRLPRGNYSYDDSDDSED
uniref:translational initiation factor 1 n=1 Tax=Lophophora diffusa TaxID=130137 RepID=UPI0020798F50|nr:translational initiation factor 1 [Lophophora diffusa]URP30859.1 translational initiation factor 1 [Lophophora diffusa]